MTIIYTEGVRRSDLADANSRGVTEMTTMTGSDKQIAWATKIRAEKLATGAYDEADRAVLCAVADASWWIDRRGYNGTDLLKLARQMADGAPVVGLCVVESAIPADWPSRAPYRGPAICVIRDNWGSGSAREIERFVAADESRASTRAAINAAKERCDALNATWWR